MASDRDRYRDELEALLHDLDSRAHDEDQVERWANFFIDAGYADDEVYAVVFDALRKGRGKKDAEEFASRVRRRFEWQSFRSKKGRKP